jgi:hypothetical protein
MAWPTTKATTDHLDNQADDPNQARPEIKKNIENVNDIIDFFPSGTVSTAPGIFTFGTSIPSITAATTKDTYFDVENTFVEITPGGTGISVNSTDTFKLDIPAGSYWIESMGRGMFGINQGLRGREHNIKLVKTIGASSTDIQEITVGGDVGGDPSDSWLSTYVPEGAGFEIDYWSPFNFQTSVVYASAGTMKVQHEHSYVNFGTIGDTPAIFYYNGLAFKITKYA